MSVYAGPSDWWTNETNDGRTHIATKGTVQSGLVLNLDAGVSSSYPGTGSTWFDLSGAGNHATLYNSPTWSDTNGGTFTFSGANQYAQVPSAGFTTWTSGITIFCIVNFGDTNGFERIIDFGSSNPLNNIIVARGSAANFGNFEYYFANGTTFVGGVNAANAIVNNQTAIFAAVSDGVNSSSYKNGIMIATSADTDLPQTVSRTNCYIGRSNYPTNPYFSGTMNVLMIYNRGLTSAEIQQNFNALRGRFGI